MGLLALGVGLGRETWQPGSVLCPGRVPDGITGVTARAC